MPNLSDQLSDKDQWSKIRDIFSEAVELNGPEQNAFLDRACAHSYTLRQRLERLLRYHNESGLLDEALVQEVGETAGFEPGDVVCGRFRIVRFIGEGGMGEVYEGEDNVLGERIAIKTIRPAVACEAELTVRLRREVQLARQVSHINVCRVFELWEHETAPGKTTFLTMEMLEGETLAEHLKTRGALSAAEALPLVKQIAAGLAEVHRLGIIHRDLKLSNLYLAKAPGGGTRVVVTDFGLARPMNPLDHAKTRTGLAYGTPAYMAPEQFESGQTTPSSDVYSFGVTIFEMLTGRRHPLATPSSLIPGIAPGWDEAVSRCLRKDPNERPTPLEVVELIAKRGHPHRARLRLWSMIAVSGAILFLAVLLRNAANNSTTAKPADMVLERLENQSGLYDTPALSDDGQTAVFVSDRSGKGDLDIWVKRVGTEQLTRLTSEGADEVEPALSADGKLVAYRSERNGGGIYINSVTGGQERLLAPLGHSPRFSPDGSRVVFWTGDTGNLMTATAKSFIIPVSGGALRPVLPDFGDVRYPVWSPDGKSLLVTATQDPKAIPRRNLDWWIVPVDGNSAPQNTGFWGKGRAANLAPHSSPPQWTPNRIVFSARQGEATNVWQVAVRNKVVSANPQPLTRGTEPEVNPWASRDGAVAFAVHNARINIWNLTLSGSPGSLTRMTDAERFDLQPRISRDGSLMLVTRAVGAHLETWLKDLRHNEEHLLPLPDRAEAAFNAGHTLIATGAYLDDRRPISTFDLQTGKTTELCSDCGSVLEWPSASQILYRAGNPSSIFQIDPDHPQSRSLLASVAKPLIDASVSPGGRLLALVSAPDPSRSQIFIARLHDGKPEPVAQWRVLGPAGILESKPRWSDDGRTLYFYSTRDGFGCIWAQRIASDGSLAGPPTSLQHFHTASLRASFIAQSTFNLSVARDKLYLNLDQVTSSLWIQKPKNN